VQAKLKQLQQRESALHAQQADAQAARQRGHRELRELQARKNRLEGQIHEIIREVGGVRIVI